MPNKASHKKAKAKRKGKDLSFCQRLIRDIETSEAKQATAKVPQYSHLLSLPPELRQIILYNVLNDDEIRMAPLEPRAAELSKVCRIVKADMASVLKLWINRREKLQMQRGAFDSYIQDLMAHSHITTTWLPHHRKQPRNRNNNIKRTHSVGISIEKPRTAQYAGARTWTPPAVANRGTKHQRLTEDDVESWRQLKREAVGRDRWWRKDVATAAAMDEALKDKARNAGTAGRKKQLKSKKQGPGGSDCQFV